MKKLTLLFALLCIAFVSCKKEPQPIINNHIDCDMADIDSADIGVILVDYDTMNMYENGVFIGTGTDNGNGFANHFDGVLYALVKCEGVTLDSLPLMFYPSANYEMNASIESPYWVYNYMVHYYDSKMLKYNKFKETTLEVYEDTNLLGKCRFDGRGFYGVPTDVGEGGNNNIMVDISQDPFKLGLLL